MNNELMHHGIKGQKKGVRRFQNEDGTLTPAGKERYYKSDNSSKKKYETPEFKKYKESKKIYTISDGSSTHVVKAYEPEKKKKKTTTEVEPQPKKKKKKKSTEVEPQPKKKNKLDTVSNVGNAASKGFNEASNLAGRIARNTKASKKTREELSKMSDAELRQKINRQRMEQEYIDLNPGRVSRGASCVGEILGAIGSVAAIGASVAYIASVIKGR